ncbi:hypothetical protein GCM10007981_05230 [Thermocladium modestius]|uniref:AMMECR1 domain-containing protein n=2 Tax=Thermocladium modestius TaxID=62609 RepID=A0A830GWS6_9CREN|nr:hypothetical protein GCM10007981_05230 [Thermocladium modestius]
MAEKELMEHFKPLSLEEGVAAVRFARSVIESRLGLTRSIGQLPPSLSSLRLGVWVTLEKIVNDRGIIKRVVKGSMGSPYPINRFPMDLALAAEYAAFNDRRHGPLMEAEVDRCVLEITLAGNIREMDLKSLDGFIPGFHGLLVRSGRSLKAVLPQRLIEEKLAEREGYQGIPPFKDKNELLSFICNKLVVNECGKNCERCNGPVYMYDTQIFYELEPRGAVVERMLYRNKLFSNINQKS